MMTDQESNEFVAAFRIMRNFQDEGARRVLQRIKNEFPEKSEKEIIDLVKKVIRETK